jgi:hypothetical protein
MVRTNKAPNDAGHNEHTDHIASPNMNGQRVVFGEIGDREGHDQGPMEQTHEGVPDIDP